MYNITTDEKSDYNPISPKTLAKTTNNLQRLQNYTTTQTR